MSGWTFADIRQGLAERLETIPDLRVFTTVPGQLNPPAALIITGDPFVVYDETFDPTDTLNFDIVILVGKGSLSQRIQEQLDAYCSRSGDQSVVQAIHGDDRLGGRVSYVQVRQAGGYGTFQVGDQDYVSVLFPVTVVTT